ncbi:MAG: hypothetical protein WD052_06300 [Bacteroidales bacterium]
MKKIIITFVLSLLLISCSKKDTIDVPIVLDLGFNFEYTNAILNFSTVEDYESAITYINSDPSQINIFNGKNGFVSLYSISEESFLDENCDEIISSLLNENQEIIIQNVQFILDFNSRTVTAINLNSEEYLKSNSKSIFSFDDYVLFEVFSKSNDERAFKKEILLDPCPGKDQKSYQTVFTYHDIELRQQYLKLGIYYSLTAKITKDFPEDYYMAVQTYWQTCCWQKLNEGIGSATEFDECTGTFDNDAKVKPYSSSNRLAKFHLKANYYILDSEDDQGSTLGDWDQYMKCDCPTCDDLLEL